ncbi:MAG TPA: hypothetical protein VJJ26_04585 [Candidatus Babeliales bacterium]|nr:hypothetical protein [Candidatus Babeliales bacterium]
MNDQDWLDEIDKKIEEERRNYKGPHCCLTMDRGLVSDVGVLLYSAKYREYGVKIPKSTGYIIMDYCMFCGKKLPISLCREWFDILENEYGLESPMEEDKKKVPKEFLTDEWWKKRDL